MIVKHLFWLDVAPPDSDKFLEDREWEKEIWVGLEQSTVCSKGPKIMSFSATLQLFSLYGDMSAKK